jgi:hypothetical protein
MWRKQIRAERAAEEARVLSDRAAALREQAMARSGDRDGTASEETSDDDKSPMRAGHGGAAAAGSGAGGAGLASRGLNLAAQGFRGAVSLVRGEAEDGGKPHGHP